MSNNRKPRLGSIYQRTKKLPDGHLVTLASALAKTDPPVLSRNDPALATRRIFPVTLFL